MATQGIVPHPSRDPAPPQKDIQRALAAFSAAGFDVLRQNGCWRVKKMHRGQDRYLSDAELVFLARSIRQ